MSVPGAFLLWALVVFVVVLSAFVVVLSVLAIVVLSRESTPEQKRRIHEERKRWTR